jgi:2-C-methyl-D-erythritol 4-phosphate cytidylyltransferase
LTCLVTNTESQLVSVVIPAAGAGKRLGGLRKQFRVLGDAPLLVQTLRAFESHPDVQSIVLAAPADESESLFADCRGAGLEKLISVVPGGDTRQQSVRRAVQALPADSEIVLVHDAVRPFVTHEAISRVIEAVRRTGAASLAVPVTDTLRKASKEVFGDTVDRADVYRMQTPQAFRRDILIRAYDRAVEEGWAATDDVELVKRSGQAVSLVPGDETNFKITSPSDWELAQLVWQHRTVIPS